MWSLTVLRRAIWQSFYFVRLYWSASEHSYLDHHLGSYLFFIYTKNPLTCLIFDKLAYEVGRPVWPCKRVVLGGKPRLDTWIPFVKRQQMQGKETILPPFRIWWFTAWKRSPSSASGTYASQSSDKASQSSDSYEPSSKCQDVHFHTLEALRPLPSRMPDRTDHDLRVRNPCSSTNVTDQSIGTMKLFREKMLCKQNLW